MEYSLEFFLIREVLGYPRLGPHVKFSPTPPKTGGGWIRQCPNTRSGGLDRLQFAIAYLLFNSTSSHYFGIQLGGEFCGDT